MKKVKQMVNEVKEKVKENSAKIGTVLLVVSTGIIAYRFGCRYTEICGDFGLERLYNDGVLKFINPDTGEALDMHSVLDFMKDKYGI